ncbi:hypothetical protein IGI39_004910 [Enterococcus sp. AZ135]|uniref:hypothetical protein n=1 Tax=unclassified Enterococcus TaxID=2608891 RepID=UPI003F28BAB4
MSNLTDKERFRALMAHPNYWNEETIQEEAEALGKKIWHKVSSRPKKIIQVSIENKIILTGTCDEIAKRTPLSETYIKNLARQNGTDSFGKSYRYVGVQK